jgi:hypothetical protein
MSAPRAWHHRRGAGSPRVSALVRILLFWPILTICGSSLEGCVLPIGPNFHDPPAATPIPELPPYFGVTTPQLETVVNYGEMAQGAFIMFEVSISDPNPTDSVSVRWIANYPPNTTSESTKVIGNESMDFVGGATEVHFIKKVVCKDLPNAADRTLAIVVSDRGFASAPSSMDPNLYSYFVDDHNVLQQTTVIGSWRIIGCLAP